MPDIMMCQNAACPSRTTCYRYLAVPSPYRQTYGDLAPDSDGHCEYYVPTRGGDDLRRVECVDAKTGRLSSGGTA